MTFPQPNSAAPVLSGQQSFRLLTPLASAGDIYESEVGGLAFALGPLSDIANVVINYLDPDAPTMVGDLRLSVGRGIVGRIDARNDSKYPGNRRGRILISSQDNYDSTWAPSGYGAGDAIVFVQPTLDVIQYFFNPPSLPTVRADKIYNFQYFNGTPGADVTTYVVIPAYGRRSGSFRFKNIGNGIATVAVSVTAVSFGMSHAPGPDGNVEQQLFTDTIFTGGDTTTFEYKASTHGVWDAFAIGIGGTGNGFAGGPMPTDIILSDVEA